MSAVISSLCSVCQAQHPIARSSLSLWITPEPPQYDRVFANQQLTGSISFASLGPSLPVHRRMFHIDRSIDLSPKGLLDELVCAHPGSTGNGMLSKGDRPRHI